MDTCKLDLLKTEFTPYKITLVIELVPLLGKEFTLPMEDAGKKLSAVSNYARETFGVRATPAGSEKAGSGGNSGPSVKWDRKQKELDKLLRAGPDRAIKVLEGELARVRAEKNPAAVERAAAQLARALELKKKVETST